MSRFISIFGSAPTRICKSPHFLSVELKRRMRLLYAHLLFKFRIFPFEFAQAFHRRVARAAVLNRGHNISYGIFR